MHSQIVALVASHGQNFAAHFTGDNCVNVLYVAPQQALAFEGSSACSLNNSDLIFERTIVSK